MKTLMAVVAVLSFSIVYAAEYSPVPDSASIGKHPKANVPFDLEHLKSVWRKRLSVIKDDGKLPIIDIESSFDPEGVNAKDYAKAMDDSGIALTAFSPQIWD